MLSLRLRLLADSLCHPLRMVLWVCMACTRLLQRSQATSQEGLDTCTQQHEARASLLYENRRTARVIKRLFDGDDMRIYDVWEKRGSGNEIIAYGVVIAV